MMQPCVQCVIKNKYIIEQHVSYAAVTESVSLKGAKLG